MAAAQNLLGKTVAEALTVGWVLSQKQNAGTYIMAKLSMSGVYGTYVTWL